MTKVGGAPQSTEQKILKSIMAMGRGAVVTPADFRGIAARGTVDTTLSRLVASCRLRRVARGLYDLPRRHVSLGQLWPSVDAIVAAIVREGVRVQPSGAYAANQLGLSAQVPMRVVFLTDGRNREVQIDRLQIVFKHTTPRNMATAGRTSGLVIQALRWLGRANVDDEVVQTLQRTLDAATRKQLGADLRHAPAWIAEVLQRIAAGPNG